MKIIHSHKIILPSLLELYFIPYSALKKGRSVWNWFKNWAEDRNLVNSISAEPLSHKPKCHLYSRSTCQLPMVPRWQKVGTGGSPWFSDWRWETECQVGTDIASPPLYISNFWHPKRSIFWANPQRDRFSLPPQTPYFFSWLSCFDEVVSFTFEAQRKKNCLCRATLIDLSFCPLTCSFLCFLGSYSFGFFPRGKKKKPCCRTWFNRRSSSSL